MPRVLTLGHPRARASCPTGAARHPQNVAISSQCAAPVGQLSIVHGRPGVKTPGYINVRLLLSLSAAPQQFKQA